MNTDYSGPTPTERFQQRVLADYSEGDHEFEAELINSYKVSVEEHLPQLDKSLASMDEKESILHSHDIKGSSSYIGAEAVRFVSGKIEMLCKESNLTQAAELLDELKKEVTELFKLLDKYMASWNGDVQEEEEEEEQPQTPKTNNNEDEKSHDKHEENHKKEENNHHTDSKSKQQNHTETPSTATVTSVVVEDKNTDKAHPHKSSTTTDHQLNNNHHNNNNKSSSTYTVTVINSSNTSASDKNTTPSSSSTEKVTTYILEPKKGTPKN